MGLKQLGGGDRKGSVCAADVRDVVVDVRIEGGKFEYDRVK